MSHERIFLATRQLEIGDVRCRVDEPDIRTLGPIVSWGLSFPRHPIRLRPRGSTAFVADGTSLLLLSPGATFEREALSPDGACCQWIGLSQELAEEWRSASEGDGVLLPRAGGAACYPKSPATALAEHGLFRSALRGTLGTDEVDAAAEALLAAAVASARPGAKISAGDRDLAEAVRRRLGAQAGIARTRQLASELGVSTFRLCRVFRRVTGSTIQEHARRLRLEAALERLVDRDVDLTALALDLGFSSHSHFTRTFRRSFGLSPSAYRGRARRSRGARRERLAPRG